MLEVIVSEYAQFPLAVRLRLQVSYICRKYLSDTSKITAFKFVEDNSIRIWYIIITYMCMPKFANILSQRNLESLIYNRPVAFHVIVILFQTRRKIRFLGGLEN